MAVSDPLGITAQGLPTIDTRKLKDVFSHIRAIVKDEKVTRVVVGMPKNMDGSIGFKGKEVKEFVSKLSRRIDVEIEAWDERLTSVESRKSMRDMGIKQKRKDAVNRISATLILQSYLDNLNREERDTICDGE